MPALVNYRIGKLGPDHKNIKTDQALPRYFRFKTNRKFLNHQLSPVVLFQLEKLEVIGVYSHKPLPPVPPSIPLSQINRYARRRKASLSNILN